jgi:hypothetical protein
MTGLLIVPKSKELVDMNGIKLAKRWSRNLVAEFPTVKKGIWVAVAAGILASQ